MSIKVNWIVTDAPHLGSTHLDVFNYQTRYYMGKSTGKCQAYLSVGTRHWHGYTRRYLARDPDPEPERDPDL